jgi:Fe-S-cluster-containing hydrogenase component 2
MIKYLKIELCDGCSQCHTALPTGQIVVREHIISNTDMTAEIKQHLRRGPLIDAAITDRVLKNETNS